LIPALRRLRQKDCEFEAGFQPLDQPGQYVEIKPTSSNDEMLTQEVQVALEKHSRNTVSWESERDF
jgi:hypothetical protein